MRVGVFVKPFDYRLHDVFEGGTAVLINVGYVVLAPVPARAIFIIDRLVTTDKAG
jgi:hypothetical protein